MSKGSDLQVDYDLLSTSATQLEEIRKEFKGLGGWKNEVTAVVGDSRVKKVMGEFVDNWDRNRKRLIKEIEEVGDMVETTRDAFQTLDDDLANATKGKQK
ncbi:hypothetical protein [Streptomyces sp. P17]|uniref:hypothetical protein n=1 Tax=Streptomyces sp. P17 TaxID=3074716 RepID=UPI0028F451AF|nr:hypothetical protein [Streptomyces sp. P17]MDT9697174.1 hypothetical protein [Streptomyces sp. P17]